jgi:chromosome segregation ATPase
VQAELQRLAESLGIAETERGWVLDTSILAPEQKRRYTLESHRIQVARQVAFDMGLEGKPEVAWRALSRRVTELTGEKIHEAWFAPSGRGSHFREHIEASFADGVAEREKRIDAVASELSDIVEEVTSATNGNGNGHHLDDDEPTEEDLTLIQEIAKLEADAEEYQDRIKALEAQLAAIAWAKGEAEEYQNKIAALEAQLAASAPAQVQTPQPDGQGTLEGILVALQIQLEDASSKADSAAKAVESAQEQAELAELEVDQARQRLQAALEAVQTLQSLKEGE